MFNWDVLVCKINLLSDISSIVWSGDLYLDLLRCICPDNSRHNVSRSRRISDPGRFELSGALSGCSRTSLFLRKGASAGSVVSIRFSKSSMLCTVGMRTSPDPIGGDAVEERRDRRSARSRRWSQLFEGQKNSSVLCTCRKRDFGGHRARSHTAMSRHLP